MSEILQKIAEHYEAISGGSLDVPEWGTIIHWTPVTIRDKADIIRKAGNDLFLQALWTVILKALDGNGERMFTVEHRRQLETAADSAIIERISQAILHGSDGTDLGN